MSGLQETYYIVGIIFYVLYAVLLIGVFVLVFFIWRKINETTKDILDKIESIKYVANHPEEVASTLGETLADTAINQVKKIFKKE